ncbi:BA14K-like protein [Falsochrobactrum ovis]|uniref:Lectin-like protein BA14k n=2 Tax=Falsochrobactrum ovis TaxID=1293442 RepID=A0A364JWS5_9HYPH|nr:BA14K-like protein [Falsochrobactrum ovis]
MLGSKKHICQPRTANELVGRQACYIYSASVHLASNKMRPELEKYMNYTFKKLLVGMVGATVLFGSMAPLSAAPILPTTQIIGSDNIIDVRDHRRHRNRNWRGHRAGPRHWRGHRGYRHYRRGYRRHSDGWWYPLAAFGAGAVLGGALAAPAPAPRVYQSPGYGYSNAHVQWCYDRYRSYRASDNTFQPYNGPRRQCNSPYR